MRKTIVFGLGVVLMATPALAGFTATSAGPHNSDGPYPDPLNGSFTYVYTGADFDVGDVIFNGDLTSGDVGSYMSEAHINITDPLGSTAGWSPLSGGAWTGTVSVVDQTVTGGGAFWAGTAGTWTFEFCETYDDDGIDAWWTNLSFEFQDAPPPPDYVWVEDFDVPLGLPAGWSTVDNLGTSPFNWESTSVNPDRDNLTGGGGEAMTADADLYGASSTPYDVSMITSAFVVPDDAELGFDVAYNDLNAGGEDLGKVNISIDGGTSWVNLLTMDEDHMAELMLLDLSAYAGETALVEFNFSGPGWDWYFQVDNVGVTPEPASLLLLALGALALRRR
ncbi:MAG: choice-of-anchor J domain-containing protein [Phycisphaerae bacterium]|nr:choice-of-anchor J domain-containing protein [Phycisphaerae bacterium]